MRIVIGADHAGFTLKHRLIHEMESEGHEILDVGTHDANPSDYPDAAEAVGLAVLEERADRGIVVCGSGVGACIAANKLPGIKAGVCHDTYSARQGVEHDDMNVLVLGARLIEPEAAHTFVLAFLKADFSEEERHIRRLKKVGDIEARYAGRNVRARSGLARD